jgi:hypothetical protein
VPVACYRLPMSSFSDLDALARALPDVEVRFSTDDRPEYRVRGKLFACLRGRRKDAVDPATGEPLDDVVMLRTPGLEAKAALLAEAHLPLFTTPHFDGWPAVLIRAADLDRVSRERLAELVEGAWATQAPKRLVAARTLERAVE